MILLRVEKLLIIYMNFYEHSIKDAQGKLSLYVIVIFRNTTINLLQLFIKFKYIINIRNEEDYNFYDNATLFGYFIIV